MAVADAIEAYRGEALALFAGPASAQPAGSMLGQLLLKAASNDKRFVVEEAQRALSLLSTEVMMCTSAARVWYTSTKLAACMIVLQPVKGMRGAAAASHPMVLCVATVTPSN